MVSIVFAIFTRSKFDQKMCEIRSFWALKWLKIKVYRTFSPNYVLTFPNFVYKVNYQLCLAVEAVVAMGYSFLTLFVLFGVPEAICGT